MQRGPELSRFHGSEVKPLRQHSYDGVGKSLQGHGLPQYVGSSSITLLPCSVAQEDCPGRAEQIFAGAKIASQRGCDAQCAKESVTHRCTLRLLYAPSCLQLKEHVVIGIHRTENGVELLPVEVVKIGEMAARTELVAFKESNQTRGVAVRQRLDQRGIDKGKDGDAG